MGRRRARLLALGLAVIAIAVWLRSHSPGRALAVLVVGLVLALGVPRVFRSLVGGALVLGVLLNTELLFGPPIVWLAHNAGDRSAIVAGTVGLTVFNLGVIAFTRLFGWGESVRDTVGRVLAVVPGRSPGAARVARMLRTVNRRAIAAPRLVGLLGASVLAGPPTAVAAFRASRTEALAACVAYAVVTSLVLAGLAHLI